jgi:hypothetical protein
LNLVFEERLNGDGMMTGFAEGLKELGGAIATPVIHQKVLDLFRRKGLCPKTLNQIRQIILTVINRHNDRNLGLGISGERHGNQDR